MGWKRFEVVGIRWNGLEWVKMKWVGMGVNVL